MDDAHLIAAVRYVGLNPVRAGLTVRPEDWPWSSARAYLAGEDDGLVKVRPLLDRVGSPADLIRADLDDAGFAAIRAAETTGRPLGNAAFVADLGRRLGRPIARRSPGRKPSGSRPEQGLLL
jgi:putative transposase